MRTIVTLLRITVFGALFCLTIQSSSAGDQPKKYVRGCICEVSKAKAMLKVVPWNEKIKTWEYSSPQWFRYSDNSKISAVNKLTVVKVKAGQAIKTKHFRGVDSKGMIGEPFTVKDLSGLVGRRTTLYWREAAGTREAVDIRLDYWYEGESFVGGVSSNSTQMVGSDDCPCGSN
jgi:hypothetical protein